MKLLTVTARVNAVVVLVMLLVSGSVLFVALRYLVLDELDEQLALKVHGVEQTLGQGREVFDPFTKVVLLSDNLPQTEDEFADTLVYDTNEGELEDYRKITAFRNVGGQSYRITTATSRLEWEEFSLVIFGVFLGCSLLLLVAMFVINQRLTRKIWAPFFSNLQRVQSFSLQSSEPLKLEESHIQEFKELNGVLQKMTDRVQRDYRSLKDFAENASHETQTPLAVILSGLDQLGQSPNLEENSANRIASIKAAATRLSKLNRNLLLLTKIENRQFTQVEELNLKEVVGSHLEMMSDLFATKEIRPQMDVAATLTVKANPALVDILLGNLLGNAFRYSEKGAEVKIYSEGNQLVFSNTGQPLSVPPERLFERFYKSSVSENSQGLGLAIAKQICELYGWEISYSYREGRHCFGVEVG